MVRIPRIVGRKPILREGLTEVGRRLSEVFPKGKDWRGNKGKGVSKMEEPNVPEQPKKVTGELRIMRGRQEKDGGDAKLTWDRDNNIEVEAARAMWDKLKAQGFLGYRVKADASKGEVINKFDPTAEKLIMAPPLVGG